MRQNQLFENTGQPAEVPLAERIRPNRIEDVLGQNKLLAPGSPLRKMIKEDSFHSFILWGPPGSGKTTIARLVEKTTHHAFAPFSAVLGKTAEVRDLMEQAKRLHRQTGKITIVFIDEIHRFNKSQQDAFLPYVESGAIILIGATTENPSFEINPALLSRCHVFVLASLSEEILFAILKKGAAELPKRLDFIEDSIRFLAENAGGDARKALNDLELVGQFAESGQRVTPEIAAQALSARSLFYDKRGEEHFNLISVFQKSIRGSDPQAALYWLARMLEAGESPMYVCRRLVRIASEDVGLADPQALVQAIAVKEAVHFLGMPEANVALSQLTVYLATAPKSNALETAYLLAKEDAIKTSHFKVPLQVRNAPTKLMKELGYGKEYRYAHNYQNHYSYQKYFPDDMEEKTYYTPSTFGFEREVEKRLEWWQNLRKKQQDTDDPSVNK